ncbi:MAG: ATP-binding protein, partial [Myxococcota bacterium]
TVEDSGRGVPQNLQDRIFDPFFTTKGEEVGTGLGLSLCAEIVKQHNGQIRVDDSPGLGGARFTVSLPIDTKLRVSRPSVGPLVLGLQGRARVLLVDDERSLLRAYKRILSAEHDVTAVESATEALGVIEKDRAFDIIICDLMMPDVDGAQFFERLGGIDASLQDRVVFCTGGAVTPRAQRVVQNYPERIYEKPLSPTLLQQLVRESLRGPVDRAVDVPS